MTCSGTFGSSLAAAYMGLIGMLTVLGCDGTDVPSDSTRSAEFRKASFGPHEASEALPDYVQVNQQRPQEQKLLARLLLEPDHFFEIYQGEGLIYYTESAPAGVEPFPLTEQEKHELTPKSMFKLIAPDLPVPSGVERAEVEFKKEVKNGNCIEHSNGLSYCPRSDYPNPEVEQTEPHFGGEQAPALDGGDNTPMQARTNLASAIDERYQASSVEGRVIRPVIKEGSEGYYTGCEWDWFRANKCKDPPWNGVDWTGCLANYTWAYASASSKFDSASVCTVSGAINFEFYLVNDMEGAWYTPAGMWRSVWHGPRWGCTDHWYCGYIIMCDCGDRYWSTTYNIPTYPNGPAGVFHFTWAMDTQ
jgi:hypothetical protein